MADPFVQDFVAETWQKLAQLDDTLAALEQEPTRAEWLADAFRTLHTMKAGCNILRLGELGRVVHSTEGVLGTLRDGDLDVNASSISVVRDGVECIKELLTGLEATGEERGADSLSQTAHRNKLPASQEPAAVPVIRPMTPSATLAIPQPRLVEHTLRVPVDVLDRLIRLVDDMALVRNQFLKLELDEDPSKFAGPISELDRVTSELQQNVLKTRRQTVGLAWSALPRLVRDLSRITGKPIELELRGEHVEMDRTVLETIQDPLMHLIRNAADHGIERPEIRRASGKSETGRIRLDAACEAGQFIITLEDDGAGVSRRKVIQTAVRRGAITPEDAVKLPDAEIHQLLFQPGFSTAEEVTTVSGRGVGLDIVRTALERLGGTVEMMSEPGRGTKVRLVVPSMLAAHSTQRDGMAADSAVQASPPIAGDAMVETASLLLFHSAADRVMAVPVALVSRLEEFPVQSLERCGDHWAVLHHGERLPLFLIAGTDEFQLPVDRQPVIVVSDSGQTIGLMVGRIQGLVEDRLEIRSSSAQPGVRGTALLAGQVTDLLDIQYYLNQIHSETLPKPSARPAAKMVLVIDDSLFFRQLVRTALEADGYRTTVAESAERAVALIEEGLSVDLILCDIEMPGMDGCQFAAWFRARETNSSAPLVAITSLDVAVHGPRIMASGFDRLLVKFYPQQLRETMLNLWHAHDMAARERCA